MGFLGRGVLQSRKENKLSTLIPVMLGSAEIKRYGVHMNDGNIAGAAMHKIDITHFFRKDRHE